MASACISTNCVNELAKAPVRATYVNLYKWPESDAEFIKSVVSSSHPNNPKVLDSISYRQLYLRSYPFLREESVCVDDEKIKMARAPVRATYVNLYKWPESDVQFIKLISSKINQNSNIGCNHPKPNVLDSFSYSGARSRRTKDYTNGFRKAKEISCAALFSIFRRLLSCSVKVDVVD
nr:uncharacterized protein LOC117274702 [Nicotiana tomentosiformis]